MHVYKCIKLHTLLCYYKLSTSYMAPQHVCVYNVLISSSLLLSSYPSSPPPLHLSSPLLSPPYLSSPPLLLNRHSLIYHPEGGKNDSTVLSVLPEVSSSKPGYLASSSLPSLKYVLSVGNSFNGESPLMCI